MGISRKRALACGAALAALALAVGAHAQTRTFDVPAEEAVKSIPEFARQADLQIIAPSTRLRGVRTEPIRGALDARQALRRLLQGTGLEIASDNGSVIVLRSAADPAAAAAPAAPRAGPSDDEAEKLSEVVVVGTRIRNVAPTSPVVSVDRGDIDRSGATTVQDVLAAVPQNYAGVDAASSRLSGGNTGLTSQIDIRGLGSQATLTLINGRRVSSGAGDQGRAVDISMIPVSAIQRIDILTDGASALYGSDGIGGVVNIVLRRNFEGAQTTVHRGWNSAAADSFLASQLVGTTWSGGRAMAAVQYQSVEALKAREVGITSTDFRSRGGGDFRESPFGAPGTVLPSGFFAGLPFTTLTGPGGSPVFLAALPPGAGRNLQLSSLRLNEANAGDLVTEDLAPKQQSTSGYVTLEQDVGKVTLFLDAAYSQRKAINRDTDVINFVSVPTTNAFTPFKEDVLVARDFREFGPTKFRIDNEGWFANLGARGVLPWGDWTWEVVGSASRDQSERLFASIDFGALDTLLASSNPATAFNPFSDGSGQSVALPSLDSGFRAVTKLRSIAANFQGELWRLPAGPVRFAAGAEHRTEDLDGRGFASAAGQVLFDQASRDLSAVFGELYIPLVGGDHPAPLARELALSLAVRGERYSDFGDTTNPKVGVLWRPTEALTFKANWGTSFRAPLLRELSQVPTTLTDIGVVDPLKPGGPGVAFVTLVIGGNPNLEPETAETFTIGGEFKPASLAGAKLSVGYFHTDYDKRIRGLLDGLSVSTLLSFQKALPPGIAVRDAAGNLTQLNLININSASTTMSGLDLGAEYRWTAGDAGEFLLRSSATVLLKNRDQLIAGAPVLDLKGRVGNPAKWRGRLDLIWDRDPWAASLAVNHTDGLINDDADTQVVSRKVDSQTTVDLNAAFKLKSRSVWLDAVTAQIGVTNLFNKLSPFVDGSQNFGVDPRNFVINGRTIYLRLSKGFGGPR
jgi:outer membrane receptor protein involved in Fe transport